MEQDPKITTGNLKAEPAASAQPSQNLLAAQVRVDGNSHNSQPIPFEYFSAQRRFLRAIRIFAIFLSAALVSVLVPILHFVLVPGLLLVAILMFFFTITEVGSLDLSNFKCPLCQNLVQQKSATFRSLPAKCTNFCPECRRNLEIQTLGS